jgi:hypothetical protein
LQSATCPDEVPHLLSEIYINRRMHDEAPMIGVAAHGCSMLAELAHRRLIAVGEAGLGRVGDQAGQAHDRPLRLRVEPVFERVQLAVFPVSELLGVPQKLTRRNHAAATPLDRPIARSCQTPAWFAAR